METHAANPGISTRKCSSCPPLFNTRLEGGRKISSEIEAHEGPVYALYVYPAPDGSGSCVVTGGGDGKVKTWDSEVGKGGLGEGGLGPL